VDLSERPEQASLGRRRGVRRATLMVVCVSALVVNVDNTILNVALPTLVRQLHATSSDLQWIVDAYAMVFAGLLLVGGSLADRFGRKRLFLIGLTVFAGASIGAGFSSSVNLLIAWRAVMGAGSALTIPSSLSIINDVFRDPAERARAIGAWGGTIGLGIAVGPIAGGLLLARFWWGSVPRQRPDRRPGIHSGCRSRAGLEVNGARRAGSARGAAVDRWPGPVAVGDHRGSQQRLDLGSGDGCRRRRHRGPRNLRAWEAIAPTRC